MREEELELTWLLLPPSICPVCCSCCSQTMEDFTLFHLLLFTFEPNLCPKVCLSSLFLPGWHSCVLTLVLIRG